MADDTRREITEALLELAKMYPNMRFGQLVCFAAELARDKSPGGAYGVYDVEDKTLLETIRQHLAQKRK